METALFLHATLNAKNLLDQESLVLSHLDPSLTALEYLCNNLFKSQRIDTFYLVTSDNKIDDPIKEIAKRTDSKRLTLIRIPSDLKYSMDENNKFINNTFTVREPHYGFYAAERLMEFVQSNPLDLAIVLHADHHILLQGDFVDTLVDSCSKKGNFFNLGTPRTPLVVMPIEELKLLFIQAHAERKNRTKHLFRTIEDDNDFLMKEHNIFSDIALKKKNVEKLMNKTPLLQTLLAFRNAREGTLRKSLSEQYPGKEMQFYPLFNPEHLNTLKKCIHSYNDLSLENFFHNEISFQSSGKLDYPGYLEIEITSACDLACKNCPQTILKRKKEDMEESCYKKIINMFTTQVPMLVLSGFGEPLLHEKVSDFVTYAKDKGFQQVVIETNGTHLTSEKMSELQAAGLDILVINLDALGTYSNGEDFDSVISRVLDTRGDLEKPYIVLQTVNNLQKKKKIDYYFRRWQYIVDLVLLVPFNDFLGTFNEEGIIDFTPPRENNSTCKKTASSALILSNGKITFCKQKFEGTENENSKNVLESWNLFRPKGLREDFCKNCNLWYQLDIAPYSDLSQYQASFFEDKIYNVLIGQSIETGKDLYERQEYEKALDEWEKVLRFDPSNTYIHQKLDELLDKLKEKE